MKGVGGTQIIVGTKMQMVLNGTLDQNWVGCVIVEGFHFNTM